MRVGIVSDSHGDTARLRQALALLAERDVATIVHCGDVGSGQCVEVLASAGPDVYMVAGNMDRQVRDLTHLAELRNVHFAREVVQVPLGDGRRLAATHGDDARTLGELIHEHQFPYVCHGHTHQVRDERIGPVRVINPGALHRARTPTIAVLDTDADEVEFLPVP